MRKRLQRHEVTGDIHEHPAVVAWSHYSGDTAKRVLALKERVRASHKSAVYLLAGCGPNGADVVAKHRWIRDDGINQTAPAAAYALLERSMLPVAPHLLGVVEEQSAVWMFFEHVQGMPFDSRDREHRRGLARLAAQIHQLEPTDAELVMLPVRDAGYYERRIRYAVEGLRSCEISRGATCPPIVQSVRSRLEGVLGAWSSIEGWLHSYPAGLVHGDLAPKNLVLRSSCGAAEVIALDWDTMGFGITFADLDYADVDEYLASSGLGAGGKSTDSLATALRLGSLMRLVERAAWTVPKLKGPSIDRPVRHLQSFDEGLAALGHEL